MNKYLEALKNSNKIIIYRDPCMIEEHIGLQEIIKNDNWRIR